MAVAEVVEPVYENALEGEAVGVRPNMEINTGGSAADYLKNYNVLLPWHLRNTFLLRWVL